MGKTTINAMISQAVRLNNTFLLKLSIRNKYNLDGTDSKGRSALMIAAENGYFDICKLLIENNVDLTIKDTDGKTALEYAKTEDIKDLISSAIQLTKENFQETAEKEFPTDSNLFDLDSLFSNMEAEDAFCAKQQNTDYLKLIENTSSSVVIDDYLENEEQNWDYGNLLENDFSCLTRFDNYLNVMHLVSFGFRTGFVYYEEIQNACAANDEYNDLIDEETVLALFSSLGIEVSENGENFVPYCIYKPSDYELQLVDTFLNFENNYNEYWINTKARELSAKNHINSISEFKNIDNLYNELLSILVEESCLTPIIVCLMKNYGSPHAALKSVEEYLSNTTEESDSNDEENDYVEDDDIEDNYIDAVRSKFCHSFSSVLVNSSLKKDQIAMLVKAFMQEQKSENKQKILKDIKPSLFAIDAIIYFICKYELLNWNFVNRVSHILETIQEKFNTIAISNYGLIEFSIRKTNCHELDKNDLRQEGYFGLLRAAERFDLEQGGAQFSTYAVLFIKQAIWRFIDNNTGVIRCPIHILEKKYFYKNTCRLYDYQEDILEKCSLEFNLPIETFQARYVNHFYDEISYEENILPNLESFCENIPSLQVQDSFIYESLEQNLLEEQLSEVFKSLPQREQQVLQMRYGLYSMNPLYSEPLTLEEVGKIFGVTRERVRQIEAKAFKKLQHPRRANKLVGYYSGKTTKYEKDTQSKETGKCRKKIK